MKQVDFIQWVIGSHGRFLSRNDINNSHLIHLIHSANIYWGSALGQALPNTTWELQS